MNQNNAAKIDVARAKIIGLQNAQNEIFDELIKDVGNDINLLDWLFDYTFNTSESQYETIEEFIEAHPNNPISKIV
jgi:hypothetical protein